MIQNLKFTQCLRAYDDEIKQELTGRQQLPPHSARLLATARLTHAPFGVTGGHTDQQQVDDVNLKIHSGLKLNFAKNFGICVRQYLSVKNMAWKNLEKMLKNNFEMASADRDELQPQDLA